MKIKLVEANVDKEFDFTREQIEDIDGYLNNIKENLEKADSSYDDLDVYIRSILNINSTVNVPEKYEYLSDGLYEISGNIYKAFGGCRAFHQIVRDKSYLNEAGGVSTKGNNAFTDIEQSLFKLQKIILKAQYKEEQVDLEGLEKVLSEIFSKVDKYRREMNQSLNEAEGKLREVIFGEGTSMGDAVYVYKTNAPKELLRDLLKRSNEVWLNGGSYDDVPNWGAEIKDKGYVFEYVDESIAVNEDFEPKERYIIENQPELNEAEESQVALEEWASYLYNEADGEVSKIPSYEECIDWIVNVDKSTYTTLYKLVKSAIENVEGHFYTGDNKTYIELSDNATMNNLREDFNNVDPDQSLESYEFLRDQAFAAFEDSTGVEIWQAGRSGRHIIVDDNFHNAFYYDHLCEEQERLEEWVISELEKRYPMQETEGDSVEGTQVTDIAKKEEYQTLVTPIKKGKKMNKA